MKKYIFLFLFIAAYLPLRAQILTDPEAIKLVKEGIDHIYNFEFAEGDQVIREVKIKYPDHPIGHLMTAFRMYWQFLPIQEQKSKIAEYVATLNSCLAATQKLYGKDSKNPEAIFFTMAAHGYIALMYNYQGSTMKAVGEAKKAYNGLIDGMKLVEKNPDFYFTTGMYNFYINQYPEDYPLVKPVVVFFKSGDKNTGLKQLETATSKGLVTRAEASFFITHIYLEHQSRPDKALIFSSKLYNWYPDNPVYQMLQTETLLANSRFDEAEIVLARLKKRTSGFYPTAWHTFQGILYEKDSQKDELAAMEYNKAIRLPRDEQFTREYQAMAYAGLARISARAGKKDQAKAYYKKCLEIAEYKSTVKEAKSFK